MDCRLAFAFLLVAASVAETSQVTPIEKVIELLKGLEKEVGEEGKREAAAYDKYACFCKEQADGKNYNIEKSTKKIEQLQAKMDKLSADINELNGEISDLSEQISGLEEEIKTATEARNVEHDTYVAKDTNVTKAISAVDRAIEAMKTSKGAMDGKTNLEALAQVRAFVQLYQPGENFDYTYHSNDIIAVLEKLRMQFVARRDAMYQEEFEARSAFDMKKGQLENEKKFAEKDKLAKEMVEAEKQDRLHAAGDEHTEETSMKNADQSFLNVLVEDCQTKATLFDQRSQARAAELTSLVEAVGVLQTSVESNFGANKKLVGLQQKSKVQGHWVWVEPVVGGRPASFVQLRGAHRGSATEVAGRALQVLQAAAGRLNSPILSVTALKVEVSEDHFVKVRGLIKDLISRLEQQRKDEATQKEFCDTNMAAAITQRDSEQEKIEDNAAKISANLAETAGLEKDIAELAAAIAANAKALSEATELRAAEKADNDKTVADATAGLEGVDQAIEILNKFYDAQGAGFLQSGDSYVPPDSDREGKTVADRAPEIFDSEYKGKLGESKGVMGLLQVIKSDFERTIATVNGEEEEAVSTFDAFKTKTDEDTAAKEKDKTTKEGMVASNNDTLVQLRDAKADAENLLTAATKELEKLHSMCVAGDETYAERTEKRAAEIEALKEAQKILEEWQA